jgi:hypothetical protein
MHGAYVLDTQGGKVWQFKEGGRPELLGHVGQSLGVLVHE